MSRKPCKNSRWLGPPVEVTLNDGTVITERPWELTPGYGRTNVEWTKSNGWSPDMQREQCEQQWDVPAD